MDKYICIHGHFYQPPRENTWLDAVEMQDSAFPYHDWNARITAECYGPNTASRILDPDGKIVGILNNFSRISFNIGPTLLSWLEENEPSIYQDILNADRESMNFYSGHGAALAQVYNHIIMPLANLRDKRTQVYWGIRDFEKRFERKPEGMWLAETAVDTETLEVLAEYNIRFTILSQRQARQVRNIGKGRWKNLGENKIDPRRPYMLRLPSGRSIVIFFYDDAISQDIAFEGLLYNGEEFASRLLNAFQEKKEKDEKKEDSPLVHVATDGETYGHHHEKGEMGLAYCLYHIENTQAARITNYGEYLEKFPPEKEVRIHENSSWSCVHGVERWRSDCGCNTGMHPLWNQKWRAPLREALDHLRNRLSEFFENEAGKFFSDPWEARNEYISIVLDRSPENMEQFLKEQTGRELYPEEKTRALKFLEMQRHALLMYTSCGWFFDEISGPETVQIIQYAARAIQLAEQLGSGKIEENFTELLKKAPSNLPEYVNGKAVYDLLVRPAMVGLDRVGAHFAVSSLFEQYERNDRTYCYTVETLSNEKMHAGKFSASVGRIRVRSDMTWEQETFSHATVHLSDQDINCSMGPSDNDRAFEDFLEEFRKSFYNSDIQNTIRLADRHFGEHNYNLWHLFRDEQRKIMDILFQETEKEIENFYRGVYHNHYPLLTAMKEMGTPLPKIMRATAEFVVNRELKQCLSTLPVDEAKFRSLLNDVRKWNLSLNKEFLGFLGSETIEKIVDRLAINPLDSDNMEIMEDVLKKYRELDIPLNLWYSQNAIYDIGMQQFFIRNRLAQDGDETAAHWIERFKNIAEMIGVKFD